MLKQGFCWRIHVNVVNITVTTMKSGYLYLIWIISLYEDGDSAFLVN